MSVTLSLIHNYESNFTKARLNIKYIRVCFITKFAMPIMFYNSQRKNYRQLH